MLDLNAIRRRAATRASVANAANPANWLTLPDLPQSPISQLATVATLASNSGPFKLAPTEADTAHAEPWDDAACGRFVARVTLFLRRGINVSDADDLAERLHLRDLQCDARALCLECKHLASRAPNWRCLNARSAGVAADLPRDLVMQPQRCPGFMP